MTPYVPRIRRLTFGLILALAISVAGCGEGDDRVGAVIAGGFFAPSPVFNASLLPSTIPLQPLPVFGCPFTGPFASAFTIVIDQRAGSDVFLHEVGFRFLDAAGFASPLLFNRGDLTGLFGTTLVPFGTTRGFSFRPQFGCGLLTAPRWLAVRLLLQDRRGGLFTHNFTGTIR
jgi:hypothetical protein